MSVANQIEAAYGVRSKKWLFDARLKIAAPQHAAGVADRMQENYFEDVLAICPPYQIMLTTIEAHENGACREWHLEDQISARNWGESWS